jgi:hypothetical protein
VQDEDGEADEEGRGVGLVRGERGDRGQGACGHVC